MCNSFPYAANRNSLAFEQVELRQFPELCQAWIASRQTLNEMKRLCSQSDLHQSVSFIAASGSLGRMEQIKQSDFDLIVVLHGEDKDTSTIAGKVWEILSPLSPKRPRTGGVYSTPISKDRLLDTSARGEISEPPDVFGKRFQLLLDCQPVFGEEMFSETLGAVLRRYAEGDVLFDAEAVWSDLLNDLIRYHRSLAVMYRWQARDRPGYWRLRNIKLKFSRYLNYAGLLLLLGECEKLNRRMTSEEKPSWLQAKLRLTPLERIAWVFRVNSASTFPQIAECYSRFLDRMQDADFRKSLEAPTNGDMPHQLEHHAGYQELMQIAERLSACVADFLWSRRGHWKDVFFRRLLG